MDKINFFCKFVLYVICSSVGYNFFRCPVTLCYSFTSHSTFSIHIFARFVSYVALIIGDYKEG